MTENYLDSKKVREEMFAINSLTGILFVQKFIIMCRSCYVFLLSAVLNLFFCFFIKDVDVELRIVCEQFIQNVSESLISPLSAFLTKVNKHLLLRTR